MLIKTNLQPKPGGGVGGPALDWWFPDPPGAEAIAFVDLSTERVWLFSADEAEATAQQHSGGKHHLYMYVDPETEIRNSTGKGRIADFVEFEFNNRVEHIFGKSGDR